MVRSADVALDTIDQNRFSLSDNAKVGLLDDITMGRTGVQVFARARDPLFVSRTRVEPVIHPHGSLANHSGRDTLRPFLLGTAIGGVAGAVAGTLLSQQTRRLLVGLVHLAGRPLTDAERDELRFELLLQ